MNSHMEKLVEIEKECDWLATGDWNEAGRNCIQAIRDVVKELRQNGEWKVSHDMRGMHVRPGDELVFRSGQYQMRWIVPALPVTPAFAPKP
jgi:hypothetical protein